jgi:hypothetical protein
MDAVVTYDVSAKQAEVKADMLGRGYADCWASGGVTYHLPYTTLWKQNVSVQQALADITAAAAAQRVKLERSVAFSSDPWAGIPGVRH